MLERLGVEGPVLHKGRDRHSTMGLLWTERLSHPAVLVVSRVRLLCTRLTFTHCKAEGPGCRYQTFQDNIGTVL